MKSLFPKVRPETVNVGYVENHPPPASNGTTLFQIQDGRLRVLGAERCKARSLSAIEKLQPQHISIEAHGVPHIRHPQRYCGDFLNHRRHIAANIPPGLGGPQTHATLQRFEVRSLVGRSIIVGYGRTNRPSSYCS